MEPCNTLEITNRITDNENEITKTNKTTTNERPIEVEVTPCGKVISVMGHETLNFDPQEITTALRNQVSSFKRQIKKKIMLLLKDHGH